MCTLLWNQYFDSHDSDLLPSILLHPVIRFLFLPTPYRKFHWTIFTILSNYFPLIILPLSIPLQYPLLRSIILSRLTSVFSSAGWVIGATTAYLAHSFRPMSSTSTIRGAYKGARSLVGATELIHSSLQ